MTTSVSEQLRRVVFTGGPGAGKTTILELLREQGFAVGRDAARDIIRDRKARGLNPRPDPEEFARQVLDRELAAYAAATTSPSFFERSVLDAAASLRHAGGISELDCKEMVATHPYDQVFIFPPWEAIYQQDEERDHEFSHAVRVYGLTQDLYARFGYEPLEVPKGSPAQRLEFIFSALIG